jgi:hypothetical protein
VFQQRLDHMSAVVDTKLVWDREEQGVGAGNRFILCQLFDQLLRRPGIGLTEACDAAVDVTNLIL